MSYNVHVLGNGKSRETVDLNKLNGTVIGCNAIHRDYTPDILCCADERMVEEAQHNAFPNPIYTRVEWNKKLNAEPFAPKPYIGDKKWDNPWHWNTGPHAINLACQLYDEDCDINLIGFDFVQEGLYDNVYKNTKNYNNQPVDPTHWYYQIGKLIGSFPNHTFIWHTLKTYICPQDWISHKNFIIKKNP